MASIYSKYNNLLIKRPLITNVLTTGVLFGAGDYLAQAFSNEKYDYRRTTRAVIYGSLIFAPLGDKWYKFIGKYQRTHSGQLKYGQYLNLALTVGADQLVFAPFVAIPTYFSIMTLMKNQFENENNKISDNLKKNYWTTLQSNWLVWPAFQLVNFAIVPVHFRLLAVNVFSIAWNCYLSVLYHT